MERKITDKNGTSRIMIKGNNAPLGGDFANNNYVIANHISNNKKMHKNTAINENIGPGSSGFAGVAVLASIIAIAGIIVAYLVFKY